MSLEGKLRKGSSVVDMLLGQVEGRDVGVWSLCAVGYPNPGWTEPFGGLIMWVVQRSPGLSHSMKVALVFGKCMRSTLAGVGGAGDGGSALGPAQAVQEAQPLGPKLGEEQSVAASAFFLLHRHLRQ